MLRQRHRLRVTPALGYTIVGGLIVSQALTLFTTTSVLYLDSLQGGSAQRTWRAPRFGGDGAGRGNALTGPSADACRAKC